jgi:hypothetical protein
MENCVVGTFYVTDGNILKCRDSVSVGNITGGQLTKIEGLSLAVEAGDFLGCYFTAGRIERSASGYDDLWYVSGEYIDPGDETTYSTYYGDAISLYGEQNIAWEWEDIDTLQIGLAIRENGDSADDVFCTQVYIAVDYTVGVTEKLSSDSGSGTDSKASGNPVSALTKSDSGSAVDSGNAPSASIIKADNGQGQDAVNSFGGNIDLSSSDSGKGAEKLGSRDFGVVEMVIGEEISGALARILTDSGESIDSKISLVQVTDKFGSDSGSGADASALLVALIKSDTLSALEAIAGHEIQRAEVAAGLDALLSFLAENIRAENGSGVDEGEKTIISQMLQGTDSGQGVDESIPYYEGIDMKVNVFTRSYHNLRVYTEEK